MGKFTILKLINNERIVRSLLFKSCGSEDWCGCETSNDLCPNEGACTAEFCLCKSDG